MLFSSRHSIFHNMLILWKLWKTVADKIVECRVVQQLQIVNGQYNTTDKKSLSSYED